MLDLDTNMPKYTLPPVLLDIRRQLMEKSEQLSEKSILNIVDAYVHLPRYFPSDLLDDIKDMIFLTL